MMRPTPRIGESGGSSGCIESLTPAFSATGSTLLEEVFEVGPELLFADRRSVGDVGRARRSASKLVTTEPPREGVLMLVRTQLKSVIHS